MKFALDIPTERLADFCQRWKVAELSLFGSVLREDFGPESDIDVLVHFHPESGVTLLAFAAMEREISGILGRKVDLVMRAALAQHPSDPRTKEILSSARVLYAA